MIFLIAVFNDITLSTDLCLIFPISDDVRVVYQ